VIKANDFVSSGLSLSGEKEGRTVRRQVPCFTCNQCRNPTVLKTESVGGQGEASEGTAPSIIRISRLQVEVKLELNALFGEGADVRVGSSRAPSMIHPCIPC
jgi:hypothetical protein